MGLMSPKNVVLGILCGYPATEVDLLIPSGPWFESSGPIPLKTNGLGVVRTAEKHTTSGFQSDCQTPRLAANIIVPKKRKNAAQGLRFQIATFSAAA
jgi:hypothetical protein